METDAPTLDEEVCASVVEIASGVVVRTRPRRRETPCRLIRRVVAPTC